MLTVVIIMLGIVVLAALVVGYVAFPHRGQELPGAPWLGEAMTRAAQAAPVLPPEAQADGVGADEPPNRPEA